MVGAGLGKDFGARGWQCFPADPGSLAWAAQVLQAARAILAQPGGVWRAGGTWFVGVDALGNDPSGQVGGAALTGAVVAAVRDRFGPQVWHRAQLSVIRPGYPQPDEAESPAAQAYRRTRDAAHVDGLIAEGPDKRRFVREPHAFILGIALNDADVRAAPLVVWEGSHRIMAAAFRARLGGLSAGMQADADVTEAYQAARRRAFGECPRRLLPLAPGEAVVLDRHLLHGVSPWADGARTAPEGRAIAYFRPLCASVEAWLTGDDFGRGPEPSAGISGHR